MDPDLRRLRVGKLLPCNDHETDAIWPYVVLSDTPPGELLKTRSKQKMQLARYARIDVFAWANRPLSDLQECYTRLCEVLSEERTSATEDT